MAYVKIIFQNSPSTATPINAENLNHMDDQIALNDQRLTELEGAHVSSFNGRTGAVTPADGDYDIGQIAPLTGAQVGQVPVVTNIGTEESPELVFRMGAGGGAGGHEIIDSEGNTMPQESAMQFADSHVSDDSTNGRTVVENVKEVTLAELEQATERGMYLATDEESVPIGASSEDKVEVTASNNTWRSLIQKLQLQPNYDFSKITRDSIIQIGNEFFRCIGKTNASADFTLARGYTPSSIVSIYIQANNGYRFEWVSNGSASDKSTASVTDGTKLTLYYGTSSTVINLKTDANYCMMSDGETSVEDMTKDSGWKDLSSAIKYRKIGKAVTLNIVQSGLTRDTNTVIGTLPTGYRPSIEAPFMTTNGNNAPCIVTVLTNGDIRVNPTNYTYCFFYGTFLVD